MLLSCLVWGFEVGEIRPQRQNAILSLFVKGTYYQRAVTYHKFWALSLAEVVFLRFLHCKVIHPLTPCFHNVFFGTTSLCIAHTFNMGSCAQLRSGWSVYVYYWEFFCIGDLHLLHLSMFYYSFVPIWIHSRFLLISCLHCSSFGHRAHFPFALVSDMFSSMCACVQNFLLLWGYKLLQIFIFLSLLRYVLWSTVQSVLVNILCRFEKSVYVFVLMNWSSL